MHVVIIPSERYGDVDEPLAGIFQRDQARALKRAGLTVGVVATIPRSLRHLTWRYPSWLQRIEVADEGGIPVYRYQGWRWIPGRVPYLPVPWYLSIGRAVFARYVADHGPPDLIHAHNAVYGGAIASSIKRRWGIPFVLTEHSSAHLTGALRAWQKGLVRRAMADASARLVVSRALGSVLERAFPDVAAPWEWVPNILDRRFEEHVACCDGPADSPRPFRFLNVGSLVPVKNHAGLLRAFAHSFRDDESVHLRIGGAGPLRKELEKLTRELGIENQVTFLGQLTREQVLAEMRACDAFVLSSLHETFGVVIIEALACGCPVIATACGGPDEIVTEKNGLLVPPGDDAALAQAMAQLAREAATYDRTRIREECLARFGEQAVVKQLLSIYDRVLGGV